MTSGSIDLVSAPMFMLFEGIFGVKPKGNLSFLIFIFFFFGRKLGNGYTKK